MISNSSGDYGKFAAGAKCDPGKGISGLFPEVAMVLAVVHQCSRGVLLRH
jgi:hypothetical protein